MSLQSRPVKGPPEHLNSTGCRIAYAEGKGRGIYASKSIPAGTVVEISPALLFSQTEYDEHGKHTVLDHYTFKWPDSRMALALGLGSLFNHSESPNVSYHLDIETESIRYVTSRTVLPDEEMCIFYGHKLWFDPVDQLLAVETAPEVDDGWGGLSLVDREEGRAHEDLDSLSVLDGNPEDVIYTDDLPFTRLKLTPDDEEEDEPSAIRTVQAWVVDIADPRQIATMLKWLRQAGLEDPSLAHLKRIRKHNDYSSLLLAPISLYPDSPTLPDTIDLPAPYIATVPRSVALTQVSLKLKSAFWPTVYAPRKKWEPEDWSRGKVRWAWEAMKTVANAAREAKKIGELPIVACVPPVYDTDAQEFLQINRPMIAHDTRHSLSHPLRHAVQNVIRAVADYHASLGNDTETLVVDVSTNPITTPPISVSGQNPAEFSTPGQSSQRNGAHYLLTSLTLFTSHEPCIMCSMALLHSRVKEVFYLVPMEKTGGCGGLACLPRLEGVNHRFGIARWKLGEGGIDINGLDIADSTDA